MVGRGGGGSARAQGAAVLKAMGRRPVEIPGLIDALRAHYGAPAPPPTTDPFELILWENVAYLAPPARRLAAFRMLQADVGTTPRALLAASDAALERVTGHGILKTKFAAKLRECAKIVTEDFGGELRPVVFGPLAAAKKALRRFPGIGEPGAEKILLFAGAHALLAPESNALRVLARVGLIDEEPSYARMYAAARKVSQDIGTDLAVMREAHGLLQHHGMTLCKRSEPICAPCPLAASCATLAALGNY